MAKPSKLPEWATAGAIVEPTEPQKDTGWTTAKPPHQHFNWWQNLVYLWTKHFDDTGTGSRARQLFYSQQ